MHMTIWIALATAVGVLTPSVARGEHSMADMGDMETDSAAPRSRFEAGVRLVAARFDTGTYGGDYQAVVPTASWMRGRFGATAQVGIYRLAANGAETYGPGDVAVSGMATLATHGPSSLMAMLHVMLPTGDMARGFGMGHLMAMPMISGATEVGGVQLGAMVGYGRMVGGGAEHHHDMAWPLVDPMSMQEVIWSANAYLPLGRAIHAGLRVSGGAPIGAGTNRMIGGVRAMWTEGKVETAFEVQAGIAGDPFILRGLLESAVHF